MNFGKRLDFPVEMHTNARTSYNISMFIMMIVNFLIRFVNYSVKSCKTCIQFYTQPTSKCVMMSDKCAVISSFVLHSN